MTGPQTSILAWTQHGAPVDDEPLEERARREPLARVAFEAKRNLPAIDLEVVPTPSLTNFCLRSSAWSGCRRRPATFRGRRRDVLSESRMHAPCPSGSMSEMWQRSYGASIAAPPDQRGGNGCEVSYGRRGTSRRHKEICQYGGSDCEIRSRRCNHVGAEISPDVKVAEPTTVAFRPAIAGLAAFGARNLCT